MSFYRPACIILWLTISMITRAQRDLDYNVLEKLAASCKPDDSCATARDDAFDSLTNYRCECKPSCVKFNTCCIDSPYIDVESSSLYKKVHRGSCERVFKSNFTTFIVSRCDRTWKGNDIFKAKCETPFKDLKDPVTMKPVTSMRTETTYRNFFCAICNNDAKGIQSWDVHDSKSTGILLDSYWDRDKAEFSNDIIYIENANMWGVVTEDESGNLAFVNMNIEVQVPHRLRDVVPACVRDIVTECSNLWTDEDVRYMCSAYMALVYIRKDVKSIPVAYRNIHCAICNYASYSESTICETYEAFTQRGGKPPMSFTLLLDVNLADGNTVGQKFPCNKGQIYDSHFKKCRTLVCGMPNYIMKDGKCVPPPKKE